MVFALLFVVFALPWWVAAASLLIRRRGRLWVAVLHGFGLQALAVLPAAIAQPWVPQGSSFDLSSKLLMPWVSTGVHTGGATVRALFEPLADAGWFGHRHATMLSNWPVWIILATGQAAVIAGVLAWRLQRADQAREKTGKKPRRIPPDPVLIGVLLAVLLNAILNIHWPWWGT